MRASGAIECLFLDACDAQTACEYIKNRVQLIMCAVAFCNLLFRFAQAIASSLRRAHRAQLAHSFRGPFKLVELPNDREIGLGVCGNDY
jgi:hypothetical protein